MPEARASLEELENREEFVRRHNGPGEADIAAMLGALGLASLDELIERHPFAEGALRNRAMLCCCRAAIAWEPGRAWFGDQHNCACGGTY